MAILAGAGAAAVCAGIWSAISFFTGMQLGLMAIALGCAVGISVKKFGKSNDRTFGIIAAVEALVGCMAGNLLTICLVLSKQTGVPFFDILGRLTPDMILDLMSKTFDAMDLLFYGIAIYEAFKLSTAPQQAVNRAGENKSPAA